MSRATWSGLVLAAVMAIGGSAQAATAEKDQPTTQPTTQPAVQPNYRKAAALLPALGGLYASLQDALAKKDVETAKELADDMMKQAKLLQAYVKGSDAEDPLRIAVETGAKIQKALNANDLEKAATYMKTIDQMGQQLAETIQNLAAAQAKPAQ